MTLTAALNPSLRVSAAIPAKCSMISGRHPGAVGRGPRHEAAAGRRARHGRPASHEDLAAHALVPKALVPELRRSVHAEALVGVV